MKHFNRQAFDNLVTKPIVQRPPNPFPGKYNPVRIAWQLLYVPSISETTVIPGTDGDGRKIYRRVPVPASKVLQEFYIGKPNRIRIRGMHNKFRQLRKEGRVVSMVVLEFDKSGTIARQIWNGEALPAPTTSYAYIAFHPQICGNNILEEYTGKTFVKRIGRLPLYSHLKTLTVERIDAYYAWYEKTFQKRLRRPKAPPMHIEGAVQSEDV